MRALLEGCFPARSARKRSANACAKAPRSAGPIICTEFCAVLTRRPRKRVHGNDTPKLIRAIEVCLASRQKMSELWQQGRDPLRGFRIFRIGLDPDRAALYERINQRAERMFETGLVEETESSASQIRRRRSATRIARIQTGSSISTRRNDERASHSSRPAGPPQLCQAPDDMVPSRARGAMAKGFRRRPANSGASLARGHGRKPVGSQARLFSRSREGP